MTDHPTYKILQTSDEPNAAWQVYKLQRVNEAGTVTYERQPDYKTTGSIIFFKTEQGAQDWIDEQLDTPSS